MIRSKFSLILSMLVVFASGVVVGVVSHGYWVGKNQPPKQEARKGPEEYRRAYVAEMKKRLKLDEAQGTKLVQILDETRDKYRALRDKMRPDMDAIQQEQVDRINGMLSPEQQQEYTRMRKERDDKRKADDAKRKSEESAPKSAK